MRWAFRRRTWPDISARSPDESRGNRGRWSELARPRLLRGPLLNARGAKIVISQHPRRAAPLAIDEEMYKWRHLIENFFCKIKEFKRIAMRADKTDTSFTAFIHLTATVIHSR